MIVEAACSRVLLQRRLIAKRPTLLKFFFISVGLIATLGAHECTHANEENGEQVATQEAYLDVRVNGKAMPPTLALIWPDGRVAVHRSQLAIWRIVSPSPNDASAAWDPLISLDALKDTTYTIDKASQTLLIATAPSALFHTVVGDRWRPVAAPLAAQPGGFFNYDMAVQSVNHRTSGIGFFEGVVFGPFGTVVNTVITRTAPLLSTLRLDSTWTIDRPSQRATWRLGDSISRAASWSQPVRFGGLQYSTNFSVQPGFNAQAAQGQSGIATLASTIDIYVNNALRMRAEVPAGPFNIAQLPVVNGAGETRLVVRDMLGRQQTITMPFYASPQLLQAGLRDFSYEIGVVRQRYGFASNDYAHWLGIATERHGISNDITGEVHAEVSRTRQALGLGSVWLWRTAGVFSASIAGSRFSPEPVDGMHGAERRGGLVSIGFQREAERLSFGGNWTSATAGFVSLSRLTSPTTEMGDLPYAGIPVSDPQRQARAYASYATQRNGSVGVDYTYRSFPDRPVTRLLGVSYGLSVGRGYMSVALLRDLHAGQTFASVMLSSALSHDVNGSVGVTSQSGRPPVSQWQAQRDLPAGQGFGYRVGISAERTPSADGSLQFQNDHGSLAFDISQHDGLALWRLGAAGGLAMIRGEVFASRTISESFSVVDAGGFANVHVYANNQLVGRTDARGMAIVPRLLAYQTTPIRIEQADLPLGAGIGSLETAAIPWFRSGLLLRFAVRQSRGGLLTVMLEDGTPAPAGAMAHVAGSDFSQPVADQGELYLTGLPSKAEVFLAWDSRRCVMVVDFPETTDPLPRLGTFVCREVRK